MATLSLQTADYIIFQLIRRNLKGKDAAQRVWKEVRTFHLAVKPATITYSEATRSTITQTSPNAGFLDRFGSRLVEVSMIGTFGLQPRREGLILKDGLTRLREFRTELFRQSQLARQQKEDGGALYVYAVNYYDFINDERFTINFDTFVRTLDARRNAFEPTYQLRFTALGEPIEEARTSDPILSLLLAIDSVFKSVDEALQKILGNKVVAGISNLVEMMEVMAQTTENIGTLSTMYAAAIAGQITSLSSLGASTASVLNQSVSEIGRIVAIKG